MIIPPAPTPAPTPAPDPEDLAARALAAAPTLLENFFWGWLSGDEEACRLYFEELITMRDLVGPGDVPEDVL